MAKINLGLCILAACVTACSLTAARGDDGSELIPLEALPEAGPAAKPETKKEAGQEMSFKDPIDGAYDVSKFLSSRVGFLPLVIPITEPAVGYGLAFGLSFFHDKPQVVNYNGEKRVIMPSITMIFGAGTENGTWATGVGHIGVWNEGKIRYVGAMGYANLDLNWYGRGDLLGNSPISYTNDVLFLYQKLMFKIADTDFFLGPQYRFLDTDASFERNSLIGSGIVTRELASRTAGLGLILSYDSLDHPFSPSKGVRSEITYSQQADYFGGQFNYGKLTAFGITYIPVSEKFIIGLRMDTGLIAGGTAPFYDLPGIVMRGIPRGRFVDNDMISGEIELRYDVTERWTLIGFAGAGRVADTFDALRNADTHSAVGGGFRYLLAREYGLRIGIDIGYADDGDWTFYVSIGTGWVRP